MKHHEIFAFEFWKGFLLQVKERILISIKTNKFILN